jgi:AraC-like DNA-binding protein
LERCLDDLRDPALADVPIARIAARWGMANHAQFSRAFRAAYGVTPREARAALPLAPRTDGA